MKLSRREMFTGFGGLIGSAVVSSGGTRRADSSEYGLEPGLIYLNTGSLGPTPRSVCDEVLKAWNDLELNPVNKAYGGTAYSLADKTRGLVGELLGCTADEILLTRSTTNAMTTAGLGIELARGDRVLTTDVEHEGGSAVWKHLEKRRGVIIDRVSIPPEDHDAKGIVERFAAAITKETKVISVSHVITSTGLRMPVREIVTLAKSRKILSVIDGAQAVGNTPVDVKAIGCDAYAAPGHKWLLAPKGTGFLYISKDAAARIQPVEWTDGKAYVVGSAGMGSLPLVVGLGAAIQAAQKRGIAATESRNLILRNRAYDGLKRIGRIKIVSAPPGALATVLIAFRLPDAVDSFVLRTIMREKYNVMLKQTEKRWGNGMRISPHVFNTEADIDAALKAITTELS